MVAAVRSTLGALALAAALSACASGPSPDDYAYCYRTLAEADCYRSPQPGQAYRLIGYFGPAPR